MEAFLLNKARTMREKILLSQIEKRIIAASKVAVTWAKKYRADKQNTQITEIDTSSDSDTTTCTKAVSNAVAEAVSKVFAEDPSKLLNEGIRDLLVEDVSKRVTADLGPQIIEALNKPLIEQLSKLDKLDRLDELLEKLAECEVSIATASEPTTLAPPKLAQNHGQTLLSPPMSRKPVRYTDLDVSSTNMSLTEFPISPSVNHQPLQDDRMKTGLPLKMSAGSIEDICSKCLQKFPSRNMMHAHIRRDHSDGAPNRRNFGEHRLTRKKRQTEHQKPGTQKREPRTLDARKRELKNVESKIVKREFGAPKPLNIADLGKVKKKAVWHATAIQHTELEQEVMRQRAELEALRSSKQVPEQVPVKPLMRRASF